MPDFTILATAEDVAAAAAAEIADALRQGSRTLVLAGGTTPRRCYELLRQQTVMWGLVSVLFGDERCVPPNHPDSNYGMACDSLLDHVAPATVYRIPAELGPEVGAEEYSRVIGAVSPLDVVLLGVGEDGHTASLFPGHPALDAGGLAVGVTSAPKPPTHRVSLTFQPLRAARRVIILATGAGKADAVARGERGEVPAGMIEGARWLIDAAAATQLPARYSREP